MILYYSEKCQEETEVLLKLFNWLHVAAKPIDRLSDTKPTLVDQTGRILGVGLFGIIRFLEGRGYAGRPGI